MRIICKMVLAQVWRHPARMILTSLAIVAAACVVIWVVSGYDALVRQFGSFASDYLGRYDLIVLPEVKGVSEVPGLSPELIESLSRDAEVAELNPVMQTRARITNPNLPPEEQVPFGPGNTPVPAGGAQGGGSVRRTGRQAGGGFSPGRGQPGGGGPGGGGMRPGMMSGRMPALVGTKALLPPYNMVKGDWIDPNLSARIEGVLSANSAEALKASLGDELSVTTRAGEFRVKIIGIINQVAKRPFEDGVRRATAMNGPQKLLRGKCNEDQSKFSADLTLLLKSSIFERIKQLAHLAPSGLGTPHIQKPTKPLDVRLRSSCRRAQTDS